MALGVSVAVMNPGSISVNYGLGTEELPLSIVLVITLSIGAVLGMVVSLSVLLRLKFENSRLQRKVTTASAEVNHALRTIPLKTS